MNLLTEPYLAQTARLPKTGRHVVAQFDDESVIVYQAYRPAIGHSLLVTPREEVYPVNDPEVATRLGLAAWGR